MIMKSGEDANVKIDDDLEIMAKWFSTNNLATNVSKW